jgi:hypothetical protein
MAHSCIHCQKYVFVQPRLDIPGDWVKVLEVENRFVVDAASNGCAFFNWCLLQQPEPSHPILRQELREKVVLRAYMLAGARLNSSEGRFVSLQWKTESPPQFNLRRLYIMAEAGKYRLF